VALHKAGDSGFLEVLLQADSFYDFANRERFITALVNQDEYVLLRLTRLREQAQAQRERLVRQEERRAALQQEIAANESEARQRRAEVHAVLAEANDKRATAEGMLAEMEQEQQGIAAMLRGRSSPSSTAARYEGAWSGRFLRPVEGRFTSGYGYRINPITHTRRFHYGIDLACAQGTPIKAADRGLVLFAGWRGTVAGKTVILDHGDGMSTVYCHQSEVLVSAGDVVKRGQTIGQVGSTGWSTGPAFVM
jgi:murein DD-endopeptidase MepM/ murein hydrolase activator NlpD